VPDAPSYPLELPYTPANGSAPLPISRLKVQVLAEIRFPRRRVPTDPPLTLCPTRLNVPRHEHQD
jgi:hypothetical protein